MRTIAPNTRWRQATTSAAIDRRRTAFIAVRTSAIAPAAAAACMARHVNTSTNASAMPGMTAHASSPIRRVVDVGWLPGTRAGEMTTECTIANCATTQHATAIQKIASASEKDIEKSAREAALKADWAMGEGGSGEWGSSRAERGIWVMGGEPPRPRQFMRMAQIPRSARDPPSPFPLPRATIWR